MTPAPRPGKLALYLGAAPGVGKTFAMLREGGRRQGRGTDVVVGVVDTHGRQQTGVLLQGMEVVPPLSVTYHGRTSEEMDVDAIVTRAPAVALVDDLGHVNAPGSRHRKRWEDVDELLQSGIEVISTIDVRQLESLHDVVERITGVPQLETVPDAFVRSADRIELIDMDPGALRRRLAHGNVYPGPVSEVALANFFRPANLAALRELTLLWMVDRVEEELEGYRRRHGIEEQWETKELVAVALTGAPGGGDLVRRAARMADRTRAKLIGIHVRTARQPVAQGADGGLQAHRQLLEELGGRFVEVAGTNVAKALVDVARSEHATQLVLGTTRRSRLDRLRHRSVVNGAIAAASGDLDVHVIGPR